jgi:hypothetical protein
MITDYKGNEIKPGMEICIIDKSTNKRMRPGIISGFTQAEREYYRVDHNMVVHFKTSGGSHLFRTVEELSMWMTNDLILAIKKISDQQQTPPI